MTDLGLDAVRVEWRGEAEVARIRFDDGSGGRASALLVRRGGPASARVGIVVAHGGFEPGAHIFLDEASSYADRGAVVVLPEITFPRSHDVAEHEVALERAIRLQRRAVDVLEQRFGASRLGFFGHSAGGAQGAILSSVEPRLQAIVIAACGANLITRIREERVPRAALDRLARFDPGEWVGEDAGRTILVQHGLRDDVVDTADARLLYELAAGRKEWSEYDCGHGVDGHEGARADRLAFFARELGL